MTIQINKLDPDPAALVQQKAPSRYGINVFLGRRRPGTRRWLNFWVSIALLTSVIAGLAAPALAGNGRYRGYDIRTFGRYDYNVWRHGYWHRGWRGKRNGWWWVGGGIWYPYAAPIYPFPNPYIPPTLIVQPPKPMPWPGQTWYYCPNPQGYYPYVPQCRIPWQAFPAAPN